MKSLIIFLMLVFIYGCGGSSGSSISATPQKETFFDTEYDPMWNLFYDSYYHKNGDVVQGADINLNPVWNSYKGDSVKVAVIDDCFEINHPELKKENIIYTYNAETNSTNVNANGAECHGTQVVGVIAAQENGQGIVGVAPNVKLILISVPLGKSVGVDVYLRAFEFAKDHNASVINCSWGSGDISQELADELKTIKDSGIITVFASGNGDEYTHEKIDLDQAGYNDESEDPNVIGVGATGRYNDVTSYSNYGSNIDFLAPGGDIDFEVWSLYTLEKKYAKVAGTSFSAPTVTALIARMLDKNSSMTFDDIYNKLKNSTDKVGIENGAKYINGFDKYRAYGKVNATKALK